MEKRRKLQNSTDSEQYHVDVEDYDGKKVTFRHKWGYFAVVAVTIIIVYFFVINPPSHPQEKKKFDSKLSVVHEVEQNKPVAEHKEYNIQPVAIVKRDTNVIPINQEIKNLRAVPIAIKPINAKENEVVESINENQDSAKVPESLKDLQAAVNDQIAKVRHMKFVEHVVMEKNERAKVEITKLQELLRELIPKKYGPGPYRVEMKLLFPQSMSQATLPQEQSIIIDMGPLDLVPYSVYYFLEMVRHWKGGAFHRNAGHVLQAQTYGFQQLDGDGYHAEGLAFQEYHPDWPHKQYTLGYAGRPGGPAFYISTVNNVANHGPASQGSKSEADSCFGKLQPQSVEVVRRMQQQPGAGGANGFVGSASNHIKIVSLQLIK